jgi:hypothetical protein
MTARTLQDAAAAPAALTAFLRGVERRGTVFAELQAGAAGPGDEALAATLRAFRSVAAKAPFAEWPRRFWALLLASPLLRHPTRGAAWAPQFAVLASLGSGPRAALLLRLVAGLSEADAAAVLGIARPTYRLALQRALPHRDDGTPDAAAWHALGDAAQAAIRHLPAERLAHLARLREAAIHGRKPDPVALAGMAAWRPRWWRPALWSVSVLTVFAVAATFLPAAWQAGGEGAAESRIRVEALPPAEAPASTFAADALLPTHRDLDLLLDPGNATDAAQRDPAFYAWYAAQVAAGTDDIAASPQQEPEAAEPPQDDDASETSDAP